MAVQGDHEHRFLSGQVDLCHGSQEYPVFAGAPANGVFLAIAFGKWRWVLFATVWPLAYASSSRIIGMSLLRVCTHHTRNGSAALALPMIFFFRSV